MGTDRVPPGHLSGLRADCTGHARNWAGAAAPQSRHFSCKFAAMISPGSGRKGLCKLCCMSENELMVKGACERGRVRGLDWWCIVFLLI
jgi:hypothetical protein